ncbi:MAG: tetratricopeptide repeat protein [Verrucomicrobia bacterium]|nr:tetratricopeptide repeat protein [Verrucomicrobiota bacterium]
MKQRPTIFALCALLTLVTLLCYWPVSRHDFVSIDDQQYLYQNSHVTQGLTWAGVAWAFRTGYASNWHPLTWISHMVDCELYGLNPGGHHLTNLLFHLANTVLLALLLWQMTGALWRGALVAALFAWHPLHVESVAWASERKDVLSTLFWLLTMMAYVRYARKAEVQSLMSKVQSQEFGVHSLKSSDYCPMVTPISEALGSRSWNSVWGTWYWSAVALFACGLMSKPMLVTLPCVLLLLDFWPLGRLRLGRFGKAEDTVVAGAEECAQPRLPTANAGVPLAHLLREKLPFFALALGSAIVTYWVQSVGGAVASIQVIPLHWRIANAVLAYTGYLSKSFWPMNLAILYPYPEHFSIGWVIATVLLLAVASAWFVLRAKRQPYLIVGWLWFLGTLVPVIGLIQVGSQSMADRYMYIPSIGLFVLVVWGLDALLDHWRFKRLVLAGVGTIALAGCLACTWFQLGYWQNSEKLFRHGIEVTTDNYMAYDALGIFFGDQGRYEEALPLLSQSLRLKPRFPKGEYDLGSLLLKMGRLDEAVRHLRAAVNIDPSFAFAHINLGKALIEQGRLQDATLQLSAAVRLTPGDPEAYYNLGALLMMQAKLYGAAACFSEALRLKPDYGEAHGNLGVMLMQQGKPGEGVTHLLAAVRSNPSNPEAHYNLGLALLELKQPREACEYFSESLRLKPDGAGAHYQLALALVRLDKLPQALSHAQKARDLAAAAGQPELAAKAEDLLKRPR